MGRQDQLPPTLAPIGVTLATVAAFIGVSPNRYRELVRKRIMPPPKMVDGQPLHDLEAVRAAFRALPTADDENPVAVNTWEDIDNAT
jgi:hypothetical protein